MTEAFPEALAHLKAFSIDVPCSLLGTYATRNETPHPTALLTGT